MARRYNGPFFYVQMGSNDHTITKELFDNGIGHGAIMSPRHLEPNKLNEVANNFLLRGKEIYFDPQLYNPKYQHIGGYPGLGNETVSDFMNFRFRSSAFSEQLDYQNSINVSDFIIPSPYITQISNEWLNFLNQAAIFSLKWRNEKKSSKGILLTLSFSYSLIENNEARQRLLERITGIEVDGFYIVCQPPDGDIFITSQPFLYGLLDLIFRLKQNRFKVILGYSCYHAILSFPLGVDGFCSGGFNNRRSFNIEEFEDEEDEEYVQRGPKPRFWSIELLSRIKYPDEADLLFNSGLWRNMGANCYSNILFDNQLPSSKVAVWKRKASFQHYLTSCFAISEQYIGLNRLQRIEKLRNSINNAIARYDQIRRSRVRLGIDSQGRHLQVWNDVSNNYYASIEEELEEEFK